jgi:hypothetical protein
MAGERYVVLGLARPRAEWFRLVGQWATTAVLPVEFLKCVSAEELRARLASGRAHSALLVDGSLPGVDRDLLAAVHEAGVAALVVDDGRVGHDWLALGAAAVLPPTLTREALLDALVTHAEMVGRAAVAAVEQGALVPDLTSHRAPLAAVCGPGGTGASTVAAALAQGLAHHPRWSGDVVLADLALDAEQAMLHDVRDVVPGIQELVDAHRSGQPTPDAVRRLTFSIVERRYHLLLGLRRARYWSVLRPRSLEAAVESLRRSFGALVCDVSADAEGEEQGGSAEVEERNLLSRTALRSADVVFVVGRPGIKGTHALVRVLTDLADVGVEPARLVPVCNLAPRSPRARSELARAVADLASPLMGTGHLAAPVFLPGRRVEEAVRDAARLPAPLPSLLTDAFLATRARVAPPPVRAADEPELVAPGSLATGGTS